MCDLLTIGSAALMAGGTAASYAGNSKAERARNDVMLAERLRQRTFDSEADNVNVGARDRYKGFEGQQTDKAASLGEFYRGDTPGIGHNGGPALMPQSSSNVTVNEQTKKLGEAKSFNDQQATALGGLRSFGDLLGGISRLQARDAGTVGQIGGFKAGSSGVLPYELDEASRAGDSMKFLGDILGGVGKVGVGAGLSGGSLGGMFGGATGQPLSLAAPNVVNGAAPAMSAAAQKTSMAFNPFQIY